MDLSEGQAFSNIVGKQALHDFTFLRVDPGDPDDSYIIMKVEADPRIFGARMPRDGPPFLDQKDIDPIRAWIAMGALDN